MRIKNNNHFKNHMFFVIKSAQHMIRGFDSFYRALRF
jgi:hypothetical protein